MKKLKIEKLSIDSFVTALTPASLHTCKGGNTTDDKDKDVNGTIVITCGKNTEFPKCQWA